jgi:hypothetical protein
MNTEVALVSQSSRAGLGWADVRDCEVRFLREGSDGRLDGGCGTADGGSANGMIRAEKGKRYTREG